MTAYSLAGSKGTINEPAKIIAVTVPNGTALTALVATYTSTGQGVKVGTTTQASGTTANDFTNPVAYVVTAANGTTATYSVVVTAAAIFDNTISAFSFVEFPNAVGVINGATNTIAVTLPSGSNPAALTANFTTAAPTVMVGTTIQTSNTTKNNFTTPQTYTVTATDGTTASYVVTVSFASASAKAITAFSFAAFPSVAGVIDETATPKTIVVTLPSGSTVTARTAVFSTLAASVKIGTAVQTSGTTVNDFTTAQTYTAVAVDGTTATYQVSVIVASASDKTITAFSFAAFPNNKGVITETTTPKTIVVTLPSGTAVTALKASFTTTAPTVKIGTAVQTSGTTANNFTTAQTYVVTAADGTTASYQVSIVLASGSVKTITAFSFVGYPLYPGVITESSKTIVVRVPLLTNITALTTNFTSAAPSVKIGSVVQTSGGAPTNDFTSPVAYLVTASDTTSATYTVTVSLGAPVPPTLGEAGRFVILASAGITGGAGSTVSNGDIGITPAARSFITGFTASGAAGDYTQLTGSTWSGMLSTSYAPADANPAPFPYPLKFASPHAVWATSAAMLTQSSTDETTAGTFLAADPNPGIATTVCPTELGTLTLIPGVYKTASNVGITTGTLNLDAQGNPNAIWIFNISGTLTVGAAPNGNIAFVGGIGSAKNVYWRVAGNTAIDANSTFIGNIFDSATIAVGTGANITGSLFAAAGSVTLLSNVVTKP
jgi:preprotein translocase subunit SecB